MNQKFPSVSALDTPLTPLPGDRLRNNSPEAFIRIENLTKSYPEGSHRRLVLDAACATFRRGEFAAILGKSGSGKSTLLNVLSGIDRAEHGAVWIENQNLIALSERERTLYRRENIGFVFQFFNLIPTLTVFENVILPLELNGSLRGQAYLRGEALLEAVGLLDRRGTYPDRLSGGEQQRIAIARALVHDPLLVLADEPTGNLDEETGRTVLRLLDRLTRQSGKNLLLVTHNPEAASYADRVVHLRDHKLVG